MSDADVVAYARDLIAVLAAQGVALELRTEIETAAQDLDGALQAPAGTLTSAAWDTVAQRWRTARDAVQAEFAGVLLGELAGVPGLADLIGKAADVASESINGRIALGPVQLVVESGLVVVQPETLADGQPAVPLVVGPSFPIQRVAASIGPPIGGGTSPGGGSIVRLPNGSGYGGILQLPLGPAQVTASAALSRRDGRPSFLAILGITFLPPIQLSFGFSLDRVGGIVGVNRRADTSALTTAVRTGLAGDVLFAAAPPSSVLDLVTAADRLFPTQAGSHLIGPSMRIGWLSFGKEGSLLSLDLAVVVELPSGRVAILGSARAGIPALPGLIDLRLDLLGVVDPVAQQVSVDASLVDSHVLGVFEVYGDAALRFNWGSQPHTVVSIGGFYPGFNPEPARLPALRRAGLALDNPLSFVKIRAEGYFAITSNSVQLGGRLEVGIDFGIEAHGFVQLDAIVQFRPFRFEARISAGFDVSVSGFSFGGVRLDGMISGPGPLVIRGSLTIETFLFDFSWDETLTLGGGPGDALPTPVSLLDVIADELTKTANLHAESIGDPDVVLRPRASELAAVPPTGVLRFEQRRAPLALLIERVDGRPLNGPQGVSILAPTGTDVTARFSPGSYAKLTDAEALNRPPFDLLVAGRVLTLADPLLETFPDRPDERFVQQIIIRGGRILRSGNGHWLVLTDLVSMTEACRRPPALSDGIALVTAQLETWAASTSLGEPFSSSTAAHQFVRHNGGVALAQADLAQPVSLAGVL